MNAERWMPLTVVLFAWSSANLWLMFRVAPFDPGWWDGMNIGVRSIIGPVIFLVLISTVGSRYWRIPIAAAVSLGCFGVTASYGLVHTWSGSVPPAGMVIHAIDNAGTYERLRTDGVYGLHTDVLCGCLEVGDDG